jgi:hypothetical protein
MTPYVCFLITLCDGDTLLKCALKVDRNRVGGDCVKYPMEPENRAKLFMLLPDHVTSFGHIVDVNATELYEICQA